MSGDWSNPWTSMKQDSEGCWIDAETHAAEVRKRKEAEAKAKLACEHRCTFSTYFGGPQRCVHCRQIVRPMSEAQVQARAAALLSPSALCAGCPNFTRAEALRTELEQAQADCRRWKRTTKAVDATLEKIQSTVDAYNEAEIGALMALGRIEAAMKPEVEP